MTKPIRIDFYKTAGPVPQQWAAVRLPGGPWRVETCGLHTGVVLGVEDAADALYRWEQPIDATGLGAELQAAAARIMARRLAMTKALQAVIRAQVDADEVEEFPVDDIDDANDPDAVELGVACVPNEG